MSPHAMLRERGIFTAELDRERRTRAPGEPPALRNPLRLLPQDIGARHPMAGTRRWSMAASE